MTAILHEGLAIDVVGDGPPLLVLPYPHGATVAPMAAGPLVQACVDLGRRVISFDPPGAYRSTRVPRCDLPEMLGCAHEALAVAGVDGRIDVVGHSMGAFCALALALEHPERVDRLGLVGATAGGWWPVLRSGGLPFTWPPWNRRFWQYITWGVKLARGQGSLALHKRHTHLAEVADHVRPELVPPLDLQPGDEARPPPVRDLWIGHVGGLDLSPRLGEIRAPTLICVGRHDRSTPVAASRHVARRIPRATLVVFEDSGHAPFEEEPARFREVLADFWAITPRQPPPGPVRR